MLYLTYDVLRSKILSMTNDKSTDKKAKKGGKHNGDMIPYSVRLPENLIEQAKARAGLIPLSRVIRRLIELFVSGRINLEDYDD